MIVVVKVVTHMLVMGKNRVSFHENLEGPDWNTIKITWAFEGSTVSSEHVTRLEARDLYRSLRKWGYTKF